MQFLASQKRSKRFIEEHFQAFLAGKAYGYCAYVFLTRDFGAGEGNRTLV
jgi:hypothetical protein